MESRTKISVAVITYNQEDTISQALDSILMQKGDFDLEVVVGEDCSTDGTWDICQSYAERYPNVVRLLPKTHNQGIMTNFARVVKSCTGDYVAILAGDDYWCDEQKLWKQLCYMQDHPEFGVVCTDGYRLLVKSGRLVSGIPPINPALDGDVHDYYHYRYGGVYAMPLTLLVRYDLIQYVNFDEFVRRGFPVEDYPMQSVLAHHTRFGYLPDKTAVYRVYKDSATFISYDNPRYMDYHRGLADVRRYLNSLYPEDVPFSEQWAKDYIFYKEFLSCLHKGSFYQAKTIVKQAPEEIHGTRHYHNASRAVCSKLHFLVFKAYKKILEYGH